MIKFTLIPYFISKAKSVRTDLLSIRLFAADPKIIKLSQLITLEVENECGLFFLATFHLPHFYSMKFFIGFNNSSSVRATRVPAPYCRQQGQQSQNMDLRGFTGDASITNTQRSIHDEWNITWGSSEALSISPLINTRVFFHLLLPLHLH